MPAEVTDTCRAQRAQRTHEDAFQRRSVVLGHYPTYVELAQCLDMSYFEIEKSNLPHMCSEAVWDANRRFLDTVVAEGVDFVLATPQRRARPGSWFARELDYLRSRGVRLPATKPGAH